MDKYSFYKSLYDRELNRREKLDSSINIPVTILTLIVGLNSIYLNKIEFNGIKDFFELPNIILILVAVAFLISTIFLIKSFNNFFKGFSYQHIATPGKIRSYEITLKDYNQKQGKQISFEDKLIDSLVRVTDNNIILNTNRSFHLYIAKTCTIITLILTGVLLVFLTIENF